MEQEERVIYSLLHFRLGGAGKPVQDVLKVFLVDSQGVRSPLTRGKNKYFLLTRRLSNTFFLAS
jgi:hypothetical protein